VKSDAGRPDTPFHGALGFNAIGFLSPATGLGAAARSSIDLIASLGYDVACADIDPYEGSALVGAERLPCACSSVAEIRDLPYAINLFHFNPNDAMAFVVRWRERTGAHVFDRFNCVVPFWELPRVPDHWVPAMAGMDAVLVPSRFVEDAVRAGFGNRKSPPLVRYPQSVSPPAEVRADRRRWLGEREGSTAILLTFDPMSDFERKNPWGAIAAFKRAFGKDDSGTLLIKVNNARVVGASAGMQRLESLAAADRRIVLMRDTLSRDDLWSLYASCDIYLSLHRSEGLGLGPMEAMSVGKPVVATAFSGNMDFMDAENSMLVPFNMIPVRRAYGSPYRGHTDQQWADPDIDAAAAALSSLAASSELRASIGARARDAIARIASSPARADAITQIARMAEEGRASSTDHVARVAIMRRAPHRAWGFVGRVRYAGGAILRALGLRRPAGPPRLVPHDASSGEQVERI
jgi:glycosyltransferase involved in cell wall biosynthesis